MSDTDSSSSYQLGRRAEERAERFLTAKGLATVARNYRFARGELDLVMLDGETLVFVEVRHRGSDNFGSGAESVYVVKQRRLIATAQHFLQSHRQHSHRNCRFDVVVLLPVAAGGTDAGFEWIRDAFQA